MPEQIALTAAQRLVLQKLQKNAILTEVDTKAVEFDPEVAVVGDRAGPRRIRDAVHEGACAGQEARADLSPAHLDRTGSW
jgi:hypothetical protein